jgi:O-antigen/teichoic acid export membrane protein
MRLKQKAIRGVLWSAVETWGAQATQLLTFLVLARLLTPETFGLVSMSTIFVHFVQVFVDSGFSQAVIQRKALEPEHLNTAFWVNVGMGLVLTAIGISTADLFAQFLKQPDITPVIRCLSLTILINSVNGVQTALLNRKLEMKNLAYRKLGGSLIGSLTGITLAFLQFGVWSLVGQTLVSSLVSSILLWTVSDWRPSLRVSARHFKDLFSFGINIVGLGLLSFVSIRADDFLIAYFLGPVALGYYTVAYRLLLTFSQLFDSTIKNVTFSTFSRLQNDAEKLKEAFYEVTKLTVLITLPAALGAFVLAPELVVTVFGQQWAPSIPVMQVLALAVAVRTVADSTGVIIMALGKPSWNLKMGCFATLTRLIAFAVAVQWGIVAVALGLLASLAPVLPLKIYLVKKLANIDLLTYFKRYRFPLSASLSMSAIMLATKLFTRDILNPYGQLFVTAAVGIAFYGCMLYRFQPRYCKSAFKRLTPSR